MMATEKRLIDVNKVIDEMQKCIDESAYPRDSIASYAFGAIIECLKQEPTVDAVEVVRCKECVRYNTKGCADGFGWCESYDHAKMDNDYCSLGAKMEADWDA